jgi:hypothetical protein
VPKLLDESESQNPLRIIKFKLRQLALKHYLDAALIEGSKWQAPKT